MSATPVTNFGKVTVSSTYDAAATSIALTAGHGSRLPSTFPFPLVWWNSTDYPDPCDDPNREIVIVTNRVTDTLTVTRGGESTSASTKNTASKTYKMLLGITKAMWEGLSERALSQTFRGLRLQTSASNDLRKTTIELNADAIVMNDGEEVSTWTRKTAVMSGSGAGGLDTGTEQASTWYEVYAIYDGTNKNIMLHRAKDYFLDEDSSAGEDGAHALRDASARTKLAQGFKVDTAGPIEFVDVKLIKTGTPTGNYWVTIEANSGGVPSNTALATSDKYDVSRLITTSQWVRIPFRTPYSASAATQYHVVLQGDFTISGANYISWRADTSAAAYANGAKAAYDGATWTTDTDDDFMLKVYVTENDTAITLPTGYTQYALVGYCYNDSGSDLRPFHQVDRFMFGGRSAEWAVTTSFTTTTCTLIDMRTMIPPRAVVVGFDYRHSAAADAAIGDIRATDLVNTVGTDALGSIRIYNPGSDVPLPGLALGPHNGMTFVVSGGTASLYIASFEF